MSTTPSLASLSAASSATGEFGANETAPVAACENDEEGETSLSDDESDTDESSTSSETGDGPENLNEQVCVCYIPSSFNPHRLFLSHSFSILLSYVFIPRLYLLLGFVSEAHTWRSSRPSCLDITAEGIAYGFYSERHLVFVFVILASNSSQHGSLFTNSLSVI